MGLSTDKLNRQEKVLYRIHPRLEGIAWSATALNDAPLEDITGLIDQAWSRAFGDRIRIAYSPAFLRYCGGPDRTRGFAIIARSDGLVHGVILGLPMDVRYCGRTIPSILTTGLCISEDWEGKGLVELLMIRQGQAMLEAGLRCGFHWRSSRSAKARDEGARLAQAAMAPLCAKALHIRRAAAHGKISTLEQLGLLGLNAVSAAREGLTGLSASFSFDVLGPDRVELAAGFLAESAGGRELSLPVSPELLAWNTAYAGEGIRAMGWVATRAGVVQALAWGYVNPVVGGDAYFSMDRVAFSASFDTPSRRLFLARAERFIRNDLNCFAVLMPGNVCNEAPRTLGYRPVKPYYLGATDAGMTPPLNPEHLTGLRLPLR